MALDPSTAQDFDISYETGSGRHKTKVTTKFRLDRKYEPIKALGHGESLLAPSVLSLYLSVLQSCRAVDAG